MLVCSGFVFVCVVTGHGSVSLALQGSQQVLTDFPASLLSLVQSCFWANLEARALLEAVCEVGPVFMGFLAVSASHVPSPPSPPIPRGNEFSRPHGVYIMSCVWTRLKFNAYIFWWATKCKRRPTRPPLDSATDQLRHSGHSTMPSFVVGHNNPSLIRNE